MIRVGSNYSLNDIPCLHPTWGLYKENLKGAPFDVAQLLLIMLNLNLKPLFMATEANSGNLQNEIHC